MRDFTRSGAQWMCDRLNGEADVRDGLNRLLPEVRTLMLDRHAKYGPGNIAKHGLAGINIRVDDKLARIASGDMDFTDESYRDAWLDVVGYGLIALLWIDGDWPGSA